MVEGDDRMEQLQDKIARLEKEISELPVGYISKKTINGIVRQYHQWSENGKKKSKYHFSFHNLGMAQIRGAYRRGMVVQTHASRK